MTKMTMIKALEKLAELNDYEEILIQTNASEKMTIECAIEEVRRNAEDPDEVFDLRVTEDSIRVYNEDGFFDNNEPLYKVVKVENIPEIKVEFTDEVKESLLDDVATMKKMLETLAKEINEIEKGGSLEFITPIITAGRIEDNIRILKNDLKSWENEYVEEGEFP